ncbi:MAG: putative toxin-antitoxin system toxin component, PIN family [Prosthecobacter sp.]|uniref:putative toxin-antitoxin system toxin component, PIN family n=1 Tax=Prosthecobacter sp. TaxID=1965333 RepID=UPI003903A14A
MYAVFDTSVLISALRSSAGASHAVLQAIRSRQIKIALSVALALEYEDVATRPGMVPALDARDIGVVVDVLCALAVQQKVYFSWRPYLMDAGDDMVLELALAAGTPYIITNNTRHFRGSESLGIQAITPAEALTLIRT